VKSAVINRNERVATRKQGLRFGGARYIFRGERFLFL